MRTTFVVSVLAVILGAACGSSTTKPSSGSKPGELRGTATAEEAAVGFLRAAGQRDEAAAARFLVSEATCNDAPTSRRKDCPEYVRALREMLPKVMDGVPKGFEPGEAKADPPAGAPPGLKFFRVAPKSGGGESMPVLVMKLKDRFYVGFGVKRKSEERPR